MKRQQLIGSVVGLALALAGCGKASSPPAPVETPLPGIDDCLDVPLSTLLSKPRPELARLCDEWAAKVADQEKSLRLTGLRDLMLPDARFPSLVPVWREAAYSPKVGVSLPPYVHESADPDLALHLARHGDTEAALKLAGDDASLRAQIDALKGPRNYPVEWTRLVGLMQQSALLRLAAGDTLGAKELIALHRQARKAMDEKTAQGLLGADLLARGRTALTQAEPILNAGKDKALGASVAKALEEWGPAPSPLGEIGLGGSRADVARALGVRGQGKVLQTSAPGRAVDLLCLPVPGDNIQAVSAFFDAENRLTEVLVAYAPPGAKRYPFPAHIGGWLEDQAASVKDEAKTPVVNRRTYSSGGVECQVIVLPNIMSTGALVRITGTPSTANSNKPARDFNLVSLDRGFEQNRVRLAPEQRGESVQTKKAGTLAHLTNPLGKTAPATAILHKAPGNDATADVTLQYSYDNLPPLSQLALPLWQANGPAQFGEGGDGDDRFLEIVWQDDRTRHTLRVPNADGAPVEFVAQNASGSLDARPGGLASDQAERQERIKSGKPFTRLPRQLEGVSLGESKEQALAALPPGSSVLKQVTPDGMSVTLSGDGAMSATAQPRQILFRLNAAGRVAEVRVRYLAGPAAKANEWPSAFLARWKKMGGAPAETPNPNAEAWEDEKSTKASALLSWEDDLTRLSYHASRGVVDVAIRDCPVDHPEGVPLPPLEYLPRGPERCLLGTSRTDLLKAWKVDKPVSTADVELVLYPAKTSRYDAYLIWFDGDKVSRVLARHRAVAAAAKPSDMAEALSAAWGQDIRAFGWPARQELDADQELTSMGWLDERTRIRMFWQDSDQGPPRIYTEWKERNGSGKASAAKP
jgi:hypothetical protein